MDGYWFVLTILFIVVVLPIWLKLHYGDKKTKHQELSVNEVERLKSVRELAEQLKDRVANLESILDAETPDWRAKYER